MAKIIGNTTTTPMAIPDWNQTDETKVNFIKNKPTILTEEDVMDLIEQNGGSGGGTPSNVYIGTEEPTDDNATIWLDTDEDANLPSAKVDQIYTPDSVNAQSGVAVAQAIEESIGQINIILDSLVEV